MEAGRTCSEESIGRMKSVGVEIITTDGKAIPRMKTV